MEEVEERINGINTERADLIGAIGKLRTAIISQLNREGRERLLKSFADVNKYFETLFKTLFNGGSAELALTEAEDPLQAGLEICKAHREKSCNPFHFYQVASRH